MRLIVGLGNPGEAYACTRHNVGVMVLQRAAVRWSIGLSVAGHLRQGHGRIGKEKIILAQPLVWMNQNGPVIKGLLQEYGLSPLDLIVVHDDLDLAAGRLRIKRHGGSGGHNGIFSLLTALESDQFYRLKVGIGRPAAGQETADYVLTPFMSDEWASIALALDQAVLALESLILDGVDVAMNRFHMKNQQTRE
ncbi:MAG: aminoacyl-tRNA hydrolase [Nitrospiraceae bacterium]|nr:aminoacyl-tRNA hydrolase [Nitrospiraceae bacterium]